ncbi:MAG: N-acetylgalactosamine-6-phosphate deacetylase [Acidimicrobiaceae bacterium]|nr:N-acetylgalactosamine-6-phosphate deacetylase [Acidimicrobiaceae bacterium]
MDIEDGRVARVVALTDTAGVPDRVLAPGFVDLQVNGIDQFDVAQAEGTDWDRLDRLVAAQGVTTWCPTLVTAPLDSYAAPLARIAAAAARPDAGRPTIAGAHLEGPFLGGAPGAHRRHDLAPIDPAWLDQLPPIVRIVTLAPELAGAAEAVARLVVRGVLVGLGHSTATFEQAGSAAGAGARLVTHLFNAMGPLHHRSPGLVGAALSDDRLVPSLIADLIHVHPAALGAAFRAKGPGRVVLVTDAVAWRSGAVGRVRVAMVDGAPRLADGTLAGSALTMDAAVRNVVEHAGVPLADALTAASTAPASLLGLDDRGRIAPGARADLVALSPAPALAVEQVWIAGTPVL